MLLHLKDLVLGIYETMRSVQSVFHSNAVLYSRFSFRAAINDRVPKVVHASIPSMCAAAATVGTMLSLC
jgi:hypothetical protein